MKLCQKSLLRYPSCCSQSGSREEVFYNSFCVPPAGSVLFSPVVFISKPSHNNTKSTLEASRTESRAHRRTWLYCRENTERYSGGLAEGCGLSLLNCSCWHKAEVDWEIPAGRLTDSPFVWRQSSAKLSGADSGEPGVSKSLKDSHHLPYWI